MSRLAANLGFLFREHPYLERFHAARAAGFEAVEFAWPPVPVGDVVRAVRSAGLRVALINAPAGDLAAGERGFANDPAAIGRWRDGFAAASRLADEVGCPVIHVLVGNRLASLGLEAQLECVRDNLGWAASLAARAGRVLTVELLNPFDTPRYLLTRPADVVSLLADFAGGPLRLQFDTYHFGRVVPDVVAAFEELAPLVGHVQVADAPGRHEPGTGTVDWPAFLGAVERSGYAGAIGLEYEPRGGTVEGLDWLRAFNLPGGS